jgi:hypothetical protein
VWFRSTPSRTGFTDPVPKPSAFPTQDGATVRIRTEAGTIPTCCTDPCATAAWRMTSGTIRTPRGAHSLAGRPGNPTGCIIHVGGRRRTRTPDHLWSHLVSNERRGLPRFTFHLAESGCARCPGHTAPSVFKTAPGTFPVHSPNWRTAECSKLTPFGAIAFPMRAGHLTRLTVQNGTPGPIVMFLRHAPPSLGLLV